MKSKLKKIISLVLAALLVLSCVMLGLQYMETRRGRSSYTAAQTMVALPPAPTAVPAPDTTASPDESAPEEPEGDTYLDSLAALDLSALQAENPETLGWIIIPDTVVSYPLVQTDNNDFYLSHNWQGQTNVVGAIFMEQGSSSDMSDFNTIIYGHRMNSGEMFGSLWMYEDADYMASHPLVYVVTEDGAYAYRVFAAYYSHIKDWPFVLDFQGSSEHKQSFIDHALSSSAADSGIVPTAEGNILTLSTCTLVMGYNKRWVVQAVLEDFAPRT